MQKPKPNRWKIAFFVILKFFEKMILDQNGKVSSTRATLFHMVAMLWYITIKVANGETSTIPLLKEDIKLLGIIVEGIFYVIIGLVIGTKSENLFKKDKPKEDGANDGN